MFSIGTKLDQLKKVVYITAILLGLWLTLILVISGYISNGSLHLPSIQQVVFKFPLAVTITFFSWIAIIKWLWKYPPFTWSFVLGIPVLEGTWTGHLESDWTPDASVASKPKLIPIVFCVQQTALDLTFSCFTEHQRSSSHVVGLIGKDAAESLHMTYTYTLAKEFQPGLGIQHGAGYGEIVSTNPREFRGQYWTSTGTKGRIILERRTDKKTVSYIATSKQFPLTGWRRF